MSARRVSTVVASVLIFVLCGGVATVVHQRFFDSRTITAVFTSATGIYPGDQVRVAGIGVGTVSEIVPDGAQARVTMSLDHSVVVPAEAKAIIVAQNLVAARYVQLVPAYTDSGPTLPDDAVIPIQRTAVPVEWDEVKKQLMRLATDLGPKDGATGTSAARFIDSAAGAMHGNGVKLREMLTQLSGAGRILAEGSGNIVEIVKNLQTLVTALHGSGDQIVAFEDHLATVSSVLNGSRTDLDAALTDLASVIDDVERFVNGTREKTAEQLQRLANVTQTVADHRADLENVLHAAPTGFSNGYNIYNPDTASPIGSFVFTNFSNPVQFICGMIGAVENTTAATTATKCTEYLGPALELLDFNYLPIPLNPVLMKSPSPENLVYSDPALAPGGTGPVPGPPETPPSVSAYTGDRGDVPPPPGYPAVVTPGSVTPPNSLSDMLLPVPAVPLPAEQPVPPPPGPAS